MKIAFIYGPQSLAGRHIDFDHLESSPRGLTGSEVSCVQYALGMRARGHQVGLFVEQAPGSPHNRSWRGIRLAGLEQFPGSASDWDAVLSWNEPDMLRQAPPTALRVVNQQLNDFNYCQPGYDDHVDIYTSPSAHHRDYVRKLTPSPDKWIVVPNGCDPAAYDVDGLRVPGRVIWASSADRGLHLLLYAWPRIRSLVPHATLKCFYNFNYAHLEGLDAVAGVPVDIREVAQRVRYIRYAVRKLAPHGVEHVGSVSRDQICREMARSEVLAYPCETVRYTEGFSVTTLEACAAGVLPVISKVDALESIYCPPVPAVDSPAGQNLDALVGFVVRGLTDHAWREETTAKTRGLARQYAWHKLCADLEDHLEYSLIAKRAAAATSDAAQ